MRFLRKLSVFLLLLSILFTGTVNVNAISMITQVRVSCRRGNSNITKVYVQSHKIEAVLNYLRLLNDGSAADTDPEKLLGDSFEIILYDSTGKHSIYRQKANRFISKNSQPWENILPQQASLLYPLIQAIPTDKKDVFD